MTSGCKVQNAWPSPLYQVIVWLRSEYNIFSEAYLPCACTQKITIMCSIHGAHTHGG